MPILSFALEVKAVGDDGVFEGYASTFGNKDLGGDIVEPGAFRKSLGKRGARGVKMLLDHDPSQRIGVWESIAEDSTGLAVKGRLLLDKQIARDAYVDLKAGALDGMSIGYRVEEDAMDGRRRARLLKSVDLLEISLVPFPMNEAARVMAVKSLTPDEKREIEGALCDAGLSRADRRKAVAALESWLQCDAGGRPAPRDEESAAELAAIIRRNIATLS